VEAEPFCHRQGELRKETESLLLSPSPALGPWYFSSPKLGAEAGVKPSGLSPTGTFSDKCEKRLSEFSDESSLFASSSKELIKSSAAEVSFFLLMSSD
jgi:hypothetical protein